MKDKLNFDDLALREIPVTYKGASYTLREASENAATKYRDAIQSRVKFNADGKAVGAKGSLAETQSLLVSLCLWDDDDKLVPKDKLRTWPTRFVTELFDSAAEISEIVGSEDTEKSLQKELDETQEKLDKLREDELGNEQSDTMDESD